MNRLPAFALLVLASSPSLATTYEVGPTHTYTTLNAVAGLLNPGDLVLVDGGATYPAALLFRNGSEALPITIRGVRANGQRPVFSGGTNTLEVQSNHTIVEGIELTGGSARCFYHHAHNVTLRDALDASGDPSEMASRASVARFAQAGIIPTSTNAVLSEVHRTWNRPDAGEIAKLYGLVSPNYTALAESYQKAQEVARQKK